MKNTKLITASIFSALTICAASCTPNVPTQPSGSSTITVVGPITSFGSVILNGIQYNTDSARVTMDGSPSTVEALEPGMMITLKGYNNSDGTTGTATSIEFEDDIEGEVVNSTISTGQSSGTIDVMGQTVTITEETVFDSNVTGVTSVDQITPGMICEVSGYNSGDGKITATFIEVEAPDKTTYTQMHSDGMHLKGVISNLNPTAETFNIGAQVVSYAGASMLGFSIADGTYVIVKSTTGVDANGVVTASVVGILGDGTWGYNGQENEWYATKGKISASLAGDTFEVNGQTIKLGPNTELVGVQNKDLVAGTYVIVTGKFDATGTVVASKIAGIVFSNAFLLGTVTERVATSANIGTLTITVPLVNTSETFSVNNDTVMVDGYKDETGSYVQNTMFNLEAIAANDFVIVKFYTDSATGDKIATAVYKLNKESYTQP